MKTQSNWESRIPAQLMLCALKAVNVEIIFIYIQILNIKTAMKHASGIHIPPNIALPSPRYYLGVSSVSLLTFVDSKNILTSMQFLWSWVLQYQMQFVLQSFCLYISGTTQWSHLSFLATLGRWNFKTHWHQIHEKATPTLGLCAFPKYFSTNPWPKNILSTPILLNTDLF